MSEAEQCYYIRIEFPPDASETDVDRVSNAVINVKEGYEDEFGYDIFVSGGAWYPPTEESTEPIPVALSKLRSILFLFRADSNPTDAAILREHLQTLQELGMSQLDLHIHLERERAINQVALRNMKLDSNLLAAIDMVTGNVSPQMSVHFQAGTQ